MSHHQPDKIGPFIVDSIVGAGGYGKVYKARDQRLDRWVAIKVLFDCQQQQLTQEAKLVAAINHPNIVAIYDIFDYQALGSEATSTALVMEYLAGGTLETSLNLRHQLPLDTSIKLSLDILHGLRAAHRVGIVHGDLKAENLIFDQQQHLKIADFGIAVGLGQQHQISGFGSDSALTPEHILAQPLIAQSDLFAFGLLLYRMLSGCHPFASAEPMQQMMAGQWQPLTGELAIINPLLSRLLAVKVDERYRNADVVITDLYAILEGINNINSNATQRLENPFISEIQQRQRQQRSLWAVLGSALLFMGIIGGMAWFIPSPPHYVAVVRPQVLTGTELADIALIKASVHQGMSQVIALLPSKSLISATEINQVQTKQGEDLSQLFAYAAADEALLPELHCQPTQCALTISRWQAQPQQLLSRETIYFPTDKLLFISDYVQNYLLHLYQQQLDNTDTLPTETDYRHLLSVLNQYQQGHLSHDDYLVALQPYQCRYKLSCQQLIHGLLSRYNRERDPQWLVQIHQLLDNTAATDSPLFIQTAKAELAIVEANYPLADGLLTQLEHYFYTDDYVLNLRARWYFEQGFSVKGKNIMARLVQQRPSVQHYFNYALMLYKVGELNQAIDVLNQLLHKVPTYQAAQALRADLLFYQGQWPLVINAYLALIKLPQYADPVTLNNLGLAYLMEGQLPQATDYFTQAMAEAGQHPQIMLNLADANYLNGAIKPAADLYQQVIALTEQLDHKNQNDYMTLALAHGRLGAHEQALSALKQVLQLQLNDPFMTFNVALVYLFLDDKTTCYDYLNQALKQGIPQSWLASPWLQVLAQDPQFKRLSNASDYVQLVPDPVTAN